MIYNQLRMPIKTQRDLATMRATLEQLEANQDYIAMMTDIELEEEESEVE